MKRTISTLLLVLLCLTPITTRYWIQETYGAECEDSCSDPVQLARMSPTILGSGSVAVAVTNFCNDANAIGCWYMNGAEDGNGSQSEPDRTTNGNDLAVSASDLIEDTATVPTGYSGRARDFELTNADYLYIADGTELDLSGADQKISLCAWFKNESIASDATQCLVTKNGAAGQAQYAICLEGTATNQFKVFSWLSNDGTAKNRTDSTTTNYTPGSYMHVCGVYNDTDLRLYINGELANTPFEYTGGIANKNGNFEIGASATSGAPFDGLIDEVIVLSRDLSSTEVSSIYTNGITGNKGGSD